MKNNKRLLTFLGGAFNPVEDTSCDEMQQVLDEEIVIVDGCYYYKHLAAKGNYSKEFFG